VRFVRCHPPAGRSKNTQPRPLHNAEVFRHARAGREKCILQVWRRQTLFEGRSQEGARHLDRGKRQTRSPISDYRSPVTAAFQYLAFQRTALAVAGSNTAAKLFLDGFANDPQSLLPILRALAPLSSSCRLLYGFTRQCQAFPEKKIELLIDTHRAGFCAGPPQRPNRTLTPIHKPPFDNRD